ncbi:MAG: hypothetical protein SFU83_00760 [Meiothermus sp.]|nr:hypothetical protein [Meiothermus sp.]
MKRSAVVGGLCALFLAGCGAGLVKVPVTNPLGLQGKSTTVTLGAVAATGVGAQVLAQANISLAPNSTFDDISFDLPLSPTSLNTKLEISGVSFGAGCPATQPNPIAVTISNLNISVSDTANGSPRSASASASSIKFNIGAAGAVSGLTGNNLTVSNLSTFVNIIRQSGANTPNALTMSGTIQTDSTPGLAGCTITINWSGGSGELAF